MRCWVSSADQSAQIVRQSRFCSSMSQEDVKSPFMTTKDGSKGPFEDVLSYGQLPVYTAQDSPGSIPLHVSLPKSLSTSISSLNRDTSTTTDVPVIMIWPYVIPQNHIPITRWVLTKQGIKRPLVPIQEAFGSRQFSDF